MLWIDISLLWCLFLLIFLLFFFFFKQKTAYEMRISDWSSDVCSSDLSVPPMPRKEFVDGPRAARLVSGRQRYRTWLSRPAFSVGCRVGLANRTSPPPAARAKRDARSFSSRSDPC